MEVFFFGRSKIPSGRFDFDTGATIGEAIVVHEPAARDPE
jgi:hypothetical protein